MKHLLIVIYLMIATLNAAYADEKCKGIVAKLKKECNLEDLIRSVHGKGYKIFL